MTSAPTTRESSLPSRFDRASQDWSAGQPVRMLSSSAGLAWRSLLLDHVGCEDGCEAHDTRPTPDLTLVVAVGGRHRLDVHRHGHWRSAVYQTGAAGMTAPGETTRLRWRALGETRRFETAHLYLPSATIDGVAAEFRRKAQRTHERPLDALIFKDPTIAQLVRALLSAMRAGAPDLYADEIGRTLAFHLLARHSPWLDLADDDRDPGIIGDHRLARAIAFMTAHIERPLAIVDLAREAGFSEHHFARRFREQTGRSPSVYLSELRFALARRLLRTTDLPIQEIGRQCGYTQASAFAAAFARSVGTPPGVYRSRE